jgi:hypothetical protein
MFGLVKGSGTLMTCLVATELKLIFYFLILKEAKKEYV